MKPSSDSDFTLKRLESIERYASYHQPSVGEDLNMTAEWLMAFELRWACAEIRKLRGFPPTEISNMDWPPTSNEGKLSVNGLKQVEDAILDDRGPSPKLQEVLDLTSSMKRKP